MGLANEDKVPDAKTIWLFKEKLSLLELSKKLFDFFTETLKTNGLIVNEGRIIDASFTTVPIQRNAKEENQKIKDGEGEQLWTEPQEVYKKRQKDIDARWTKKNNVSYYGYKNHTKVDAKNKFIISYTVTSASVHDSQEIVNLITSEDEGQPMYGDKAYRGEEQENTITDCQMISQIHEKAVRNKPLTDEQKASNNEKSIIRSRVEMVLISHDQAFVDRIGVKSVFEM